MKKMMCILFAVLLFVQAAFAQRITAHDKKMRWWRQARFGMFIHWGVYAQYGGVWQGREIGNAGEWIMNRGKIPVADYRAGAKAFNPVDYEPDAWVRTAKAAGMKYIVITAKHHDGFALFKTKASPWNIVDATPYGKDLLKPLAAACRKYGIRLGFYYSQAQDWCNPGGAAARRPTTQGWANPDSAKIDGYTATHSGHWDPLQTSVPMNDYIDQVAVPEVRELLTRYGQISVLWWDTPEDMTTAFAEKFKALLKLQPGIITNDRLKFPDYKGDYRTPEQKIPGKEELDGGDWETCMTMNDTWGYKKKDNQWKSPQVLIRNLTDIASKGGNYLLNVGPDEKGRFPLGSVHDLEAIGRWMKVNGEAIYGTHAAGLPQPNWGRLTMKTGKGVTSIYLLVFERPADGILELPGFIAAGPAILLSGHKQLQTTTTAGHLVIRLPGQLPDTTVTVIKVRLKRPFKS